MKQKFQVTRLSKTRMQDCGYNFCRARGRYSFSRDFVNSIHNFSIKTIANNARNNRFC